MDNDKAIAAYTAKIEQIKMRLSALSEFADNFGDVPPELVTWGAVGSAGHVLELLDQVCEFLNVKGECAK